MKNYAKLIGILALVSAGFVVGGSEALIARLSLSNVTDRRLRWSSSPGPPCPYDLSVITASKRVAMSFSTFFFNSDKISAGKRIGNIFSASFWGKTS